MPETPQNVGPWPMDPTGTALSVRPPRIDFAVGSATAAPARSIAAVAVAAVAAVFLVPDDLSGIGITLTAITVLAAVFVGSPRRPTRSELLVAAGVVALAAVPAVRSAQWLTGWYCLFAVLTAGVAVLGVRTVRDMGFVLVAPVVLSMRTGGWFARAVGRAFAGRRVENPVAVLTVAGLTVVLVIVFGALFAGADALFATLLDALTPGLNSPHLAGDVTVAVVVATATALGCHLRHTRPRLIDRAGSAAGDTWTWAVPTGAVLVLYLAFLATQAGALLGGREHVQRTADLTYADYARSGFWQLFAITALTIAVVAVAWHRADRTSRRDRLAARTILGGLCVGALLVVASALHRMYLYIDAYGATRARISVLAVELWFGAIVVALIVAGAGLGTRHLMRVLVGLTVMSALAFAAADPDARIADIDVDRYEKSVARDEVPKIDVAYLSTLSADAVEQLLRLPDPVRGCVMRGIAADSRADRGLTGYTVGRARANQLLREAQLPTEPSAACPTPN